MMKPLVEDLLPSSTRSAAGSPLVLLASAHGHGAGDGLLQQPASSYSQQKAEVISRSESFCLATELRLLNISILATMVVLTLDLKAFKEKLYYKFKKVSGES